MYYYNKILYTNILNLQMQKIKNTITTKIFINFVKNVKKKIKNLVRETVVHNY